MEYVPSPSFDLDLWHKIYVVLHNYNLSFCEVEAGGSSSVSSGNSWVPEAILGYIKTAFNQNQNQEL